jgi:hypothetical protein
MTETSLVPPQRGNSVALDITTLFAHVWPTLLRGSPGGPVVPRDADATGARLLANNWGDFWGYPTTMHQIAAEASAQQNNSGINRQPTGTHKNAQFDPHRPCGPHEHPVPVEQGWPSATSFNESCAV